jgi:uncharacterized OB-fold protein
MATQSLDHQVFRQAGMPQTWHEEIGSTTSRGPRLLGLPCASCRTYFAADLEVCPICGGKERTSWARSLLRFAGKG